MFFGFRFGFFLYLFSSHDQWFDGRPCLLHLLLDFFHSFSQSDGKFREILAEKRPRKSRDYEHLEEETEGNANHPQQNGTVLDSYSMTF